MRAKKSSFWALLGRPPALVAGDPVLELGPEEEEALEAKLLVRGFRSEPVVEAPSPVVLLLFDDAVELGSGELGSQGRPSASQMSFSRYMVAMWVLYCTLRSPCELADQRLWEKTRTFSVMGRLLNGCPLASKNSLHLAFPPAFMRSIWAGVHLSMVKLRTKLRCEPSERCVPLHWRQSETASEREHHCGCGVLHSTQSLLSPLRVRSTRDSTRGQGVEMIRRWGEIETAGQ